MNKIFRVTKRLLKNIIFLLKFDFASIYKTVSENTKIINNFIFNPDYLWFDSHKGMDVKEELEFIRTNRTLCAFPYPSIKSEFVVVTGFDEFYGLPYVIHNSKRLYFTEKYSEKMAGEMYKNYISCEHLLGVDTFVGGAKFPHRYQSEEVCVKDGDILLDIGCAEALFALDNIEKVSKVYLFESNSDWYNALEATFAPYKNKVVLIKKIVSDIDDEKSITLETALVNENAGNFFIKMDIEGFEEKVIQSSRKFLMNNKVKLSVCTYHLFDAQDSIPKLLASYGYFGDFSEGYMLFYMYDYHQPFLRKGVYRAKNF